MSQALDEKNYWIERGLESITPAGNLNPEGFNPGTFVQYYARGTTLEVGCGFGRLAVAFPSESYIGIDINPAAIELAKVNHPLHRFELATDNYPDADTVLYYTVMLHISDYNLEMELLRLAPYKRLIIAEIMDRKWRRDGNPPVFNRDETEYEYLLNKYDWSLVNRQSRPYGHYYKQTQYTDGRSENLSLLVFEKTKRD